MYASGKVSVIVRNGIASSSIMISCLIFDSLFAQQNTDSLFARLAIYSCDTSMIKLLASIGEERPIIRFGYWDSLRIVAEKCNNKKIAAQAVNNIGFVQDEEGDLSMALAYYERALSLREEIGDKHGIAESLNNIALAFERQGDIPHALEYHFKALKIQEEINDKSGIALSFNNIAYIYEYQDDHVNALDYYNRSLGISKELADQSMVATALNNIGLIYRSLANKTGSNNQRTYDSLMSKSMEYLLPSLEVFEELGDNEGIATLLQNVGMLFKDRGDYVKSMEYLKKSLQVSQETQNKRSIAFTMYNIGGLLFAERKNQEALYYGLEAMKISKELGFPREISLIALMLKDIYQSERRWHDAFMMQDLYYGMRDSINNEKTRRASIQKQFQYEYDKRESLLKVEQEKERAVAEEKSRKQKIIIWVVIIGIFSIAIFSAFIYRSLKITRRQKKVIEEKNRETEIQKKIIEEKNKDITDSIVYSKRIQQAKLPDVEDIRGFFPHSFILFKPKDIVSGDFFFFHASDHTGFIAAADCTGHGVPGALLSMLGSEKLQEALTISPDVSEVLSLLNRGIKKALHQTDEKDSTKDGMDIAVCSVDKENGSLRYSGANRPLWIIRKGSIEIEEISPTKTAIGGITEVRQQFARHEITLTPGDTFYIFSDGYADTFNGITGKKLKNKQFRDILINIQGRSMDEQKIYLDEFIESWKSGIEQVDDILVIGIRL